MNIFVIRRFQGVCIQLPTLFSFTEGVLLFIALWNAFYIPKIKNIDNNFFLNLKCPPVNCIFLMAFFTKMQHSNHALPVGSLLLGTWDNSLDGFRRCPYPTCLCLFKLVFVELAMVFVFFLNLSLSLSNSDQIYWIFDSFPDYLFLRPGGKLVRRRSQLLSSNFFGGLIIFFED